MFNTKKPNTQCKNEKCKHKWHYTGKALKATCPSCKLNTPAKNLEVLTQ